MPRSIDTVEEFWTWEQVQRAGDSANRASVDRFRQDLADFLGVAAQRVEFAPSGRQALEWLLRGRSDPRRLAMMPAFNCSVVPDAAAAAGYQVQQYDFWPKPGLFDWQRIIGEIGPSVGVLVVTHYYGVPVDFRPILDHCAARGIAVVEDCAHTLGGLIGDRKAGTLGDAGIFSFNYDKPISLGWGGFALINNAAAFDVGQRLAWRTPEPDEEFALLTRFFETMARRRRMIRYENFLALRALRRARLLSSPDFQKGADVSIGSVQAELGRWCLAHYPEVVTQRNAVAKQLVESAVQPCWPIGECIEPAWLKQRVRVADGQDLAQLSRTLQRRGLRVGNFNWPTLPDCSQREEDFPIADDAARRWLDVPIHQNVGRTAIETIVGALNTFN